MCKEGNGQGKQDRRCEESLILNTLHELKIYTFASGVCTIPVLSFYWCALRNAGVTKASASAEASRGMVADS